MPPNPIEENVIQTIFKSLICVVTIALIPVSDILAQGSIFGTVTRSTGGSPSASSFAFFGFLDHTDEEIRIMGADGSGYDGLNWWDDFQNYLTEAAGNPYDYYFTDTQSGQLFHLSKVIPQNSFQVEDIVTAPATFPAAPSIRSITPSSPSSVRISWSAPVGSKCHVYRRPIGINGSFFRRDDPAGSLNNHGVTDTFFVDSPVDSLRQFEYVVIAEDAQSHYSPPSRPVAAGGCLRGDADGSGIVDLSDVVFMIAYIFQGINPPSPLAAADVDCSGRIDLSDAVYLVAYVFGNGSAPCAGCQ